METPPPLGGCMDAWVSQLVGSCQITKYKIKLDLFKIIQFCLKIYDLSRHPTYGWMYGLMGESIGGVMSSSL